MTFLAHKRVLSRLTVWLCAFLLIVMASSTPVDAADTENRVKVAFLYNFARFVNWPDAIDNTFKLCVLGDGSFSEAMNALTGKNVHDNVLVVEQHTGTDTLHDCQVVYIDSSFEPSLDDIMPALEDQPVLTVSDIDEFANSGGMIGFRLIDNRVRFDINLLAASHADLSISSKLLSLASDVISETSQ